MLSEREILSNVNVQENISLDGTVQSMIKCSENRKLHQRATHANVAKLICIHIMMPGFNILNLEILLWVLMSAIGPQNTQTVEHNVIHS
jgi:hypothetical protein